MNKVSENRFWLKWMLNYSLGELLVIGIATTVGRLVLIEFSDLMSQSPSYVPALFMGAIGVVEGLTIGYLQSRSIKMLTADFDLRGWIFITVAATTLGWILIFRPTIFLIAFFVDFRMTNNYSFIYTLLAGTAFGGIIGLSQFFILRRFYRNALMWVFANVISWMLSFLIIYISVSLIRGLHVVFYNVFVISLACVVSGLLQGLVTGTSLHYLMSARRESEENGSVQNLT